MGTIFGSGGTKDRVQFSVKILRDSSVYRWRNVNTPCLLERSTHDLTVSNFLHLPVKTPPLCPNVPLRRHQGWDNGRFPTPKRRKNKKQKVSVPKRSNGSDLGLGTRIHWEDGVGGLVDFDIRSWCGESRKPTKDKRSLHIINHQSSLSLSLLKTKYLSLSWSVEDTRIKGIKSRRYR